MTDLARDAKSYVAAVLIRGTRTILVEGPNDLTIVRRLLHGIAASTAPYVVPVVDTAEFIEEPGLGNRERVEAVHSYLQGDSRFAGMVDREYRRFCFQPTFVDEHPGHFVLSGNLFWTRGHSAENYFMTIDSIMDYLVREFPVDVPIGFRSVVTHHFDTILRASAAASLAAHTEQLIKRLLQNYGLAFWDLATPEQLVLQEDAFDRVLLGHGVDAGRVSTFRTTLSRLLVEMSRLSGDACRWLNHGHIGYELMWAAVALLLQSMKVSHVVVDSVATGENKKKFRSVVDNWCNGCLSKVADTPEHLVAWLSLPG